MKNIKFKVIAGILAVFLLGMVTGILGTGIVIHRQFRQFVMGTQPLQTFFMRRLNRELELTEGQKPLVEQIVKQGSVEVRQFLRESHQEFERIMERRDVELKHVLTPVQQKKLDAIRDRTRERWHHKKSPHDEAP